MAKYSWKQSPFRGEETVEVDKEGVSISSERQRRRVEFESLRSVHLHEISTHGVSSRQIYLVAKSGEEASFGVLSGSSVADAEFCRAVATMLTAFDATRPGVLVELRQPVRARMRSATIYAVGILAVTTWSVISGGALGAAQYAPLALCVVVAGVVGFRFFGPSSSKRRVMASQLAKELAERLTT